TGVRRPHHPRRDCPGRPQRASRESAREQLEMQNRTITATAILLSIVGTASAQEFYTIPVGQGLADDISNTGVASGSSGFGTQYFMWAAGTGSVQIGGVSPGDGVGGQGKISSDGLFISGTTYNAAEGWHEMSRYD